MSTSPERTRRWRLLLGGHADEVMGVDLGADDSAMDQALSALYEPEDATRGGLGGSAPRVARWLGDIRRYFPASVVRVMQQDALDRLNLREMLLEPELLALPPRVAVFADRAANRDLYLWLAALAAHFDPSLPWLAANLEATQHALQTFPGLRHRHAALVRAHLAQRPDWRKLGGEAARAERLVQCALAGEWPPGQDGPGNAVGSEQVRPVCLWMEAADAGRQARAGAAVPKAADKPRSRPSATDTRRRRAQAIAAKYKKPGVSLVDELIREHKLTYIRVAGHSGHPENDRCDVLAVAAYQQFLRSK